MTFTQIEDLTREFLHPFELRGLRAENSAEFGDLITLPRAGKRTQNHHVDMRERRRFADFRENFGAAVLGKMEVEQDDARVRLARPAAIGRDIA